jgi:hypothetical protein
LCLPLFLHSEVHQAKIQAHFGLPNCGIVI